MSSASRLRSPIAGDAARGAQDGAQHIRGGIGLRASGDRVGVRPVDIAQADAVVSHPGVVCCLLHLVVQVAGELQPLGGGRLRPGLGAQRFGVNAGRVTLWPILIGITSVWRSGRVPPGPRRPDGRAGAQMKISRVVLTGAAVGTIAGTGYADLNRTHVLNPAWPPHARFHSAAGWGTVAGSQLLALWLLWRPGQRADDELAVTVAALLPVICWMPFFAAVCTRGAAVEDEPGHLPRVAGVPLNLVPAALVPAICALGYVLHRRGL